MPLPADPDDKAMETASDALLKPLEHSIKLPVFEGPLDLLLFLVRRDEIDIYDIPITSITGQYLEVLQGMENLKLEVAGEFFVMAATLMHIKSRLLLPKSEQAIEGALEDEEADPRWELVQQLLEYKKFKEAAFDLTTLITEARDLIPRKYRPLKSDRFRRPIVAPDRFDIWNAFNLVLRRLQEKLTVGNIHDERVTVADQMERILTELETSGRTPFSQLFGDSGHSLVVVISTFLALLELVRLKRVTVSQQESFGDIDCVLVR